MADDVEMIPVDAAEPPKANPLAAPKVATLKLNPVARAAVPGGASSALKPGLKLPPKPGMASGLKLPPKPGMATGLKLPPKPGVASGLKLPPKPVIRKPGATVAATPLPKPVTPPPPSANPMETLKTVTQKLKGVTQEIPQQAILHKTGIIAEGAMSEAQKEAAKHKTARISLSDAMGVAPVKNENAPMKTIRIKRPIDIPGVTAAETPAPSPAPSPAPAAPTPEAKETAPSPATPSPAAPSAAAAAAPSPTVTQRKTLKISRPAGAVRPAGKFGVKRPSQATTIAKAAPAAGGAAAVPAAAGEAPVADIADIPDMPQAIAPVPAAPVQDVPDWVMTLSTILQFAACVAFGALAWFLYENTQLPLYCGGLGWGQ